jgi:hypothetical protein
MFKGDMVTIKVGDSAVPMTFVGGGATVLAFSEIGKENLVYVFVPDIEFLNGDKTVDLAKDVLASAFESDPANPYLPRVEALSFTYVAGPELDKFCNIYKMPFYRDIRQSDKKAWVEMKILHKLRADGMRQVYKEYEDETGNSPSMTFLGNAAAKRTCELAKVKLSKKNPALFGALERLSWATCGMGRPGLTFEFNKRNVGVDRAGNLVLRDPIYDADITVKIKRDRREKEKLNEAS